MSWDRKSTLSLIAIAVTILIATVTFVFALGETNQQVTANTLQLQKNEGIHDVCANDITTVKIAQAEMNNELKNIADDIAEIKELMRNEK